MARGIRSRHGQGLVDTLELRICVRRGAAPPMRLPSRPLPTAPAGNPFPHPSRKISVLEGGNLRGEKLEGMESHQDPV
jgi:hypothetical protein